MIWKGPWNASITYAVNDVAEFKGSSYIVIKATTAGQSPESAPASWNLVAGRGSLAPAWKGGWTPAGAYSVADAVSYAGASFLALSAIAAKSPPPTVGQLWGLLATGISVRGEWSNTVHYQVGDAVLYQGSTYVAKMANTNVSPTDANNWQLLARGIPDEPAQWTPKETGALVLGITGNALALAALLTAILNTAGMAASIAAGINGALAAGGAITTAIASAVAPLQAEIVALRTQVEAHELELNTINDEIFALRDAVETVADSNVQLQNQLNALRLLLGEVAPAA